MNFSIKQATTLLLIALSSQIFLTNIPHSFAYSGNEVIINEIAWAGSIDDSNDEWIELYNNTNSEIDLSGWYIEDDLTTRYDLSGKIPAKGFFIIEKSESSISNITADLIVSLSLANTGDSLILKDPSGNIIDSVNTAGAAFPAGSNTTKATMERTDPLLSGDISTNWNSAESSNGSLSSGGTLIFGTPKSINSKTAYSGTEVFISPELATGNLNETKTLSVNVKNVENMYSYGFDILYEPAKIQFVSASEGDFLKKDGSTTSFFSALENSVPGKLVVASSRLKNPPTGVSGEGTLFTMQFKIVGEISESTKLNFGPNSFVSDVTGNMTAKLTSGTISSGSSTSSTVKNPTISNGTAIYSLKLSWDAPDLGATKYIVNRKSPNGVLVKIGETTDLFFEDTQNVNTGITYEYSIIAVNGESNSPPVIVSGSEERGLRGDMDKNKRVDGRDLELLARSFGESYPDANYKLAGDFDFDGIIDGKDLIILGSNFAKTY
jgi:hypothetical protein